jgi:hypothetical protein
MVVSIDRSVCNNARRIKRRAGTSKQLNVRADSQYVNRSGDDVKPLDERDHGRAHASV